MPSTLIMNPLGDREFVARVREHAPTTHTPAELQALLRRRYEGAVVRERDLAGETASVWYVYRDGSWTSESQRVAEGS